MPEWPASRPDRACRAPAPIDPAAHRTLSTYAAGEAIVRQAGGPGLYCPQSNSIAAQPISAASSDPGSHLLSCSSTSSVAPHSRETAMPRALSLLLLFAAIVSPASAAEPVALFDGKDMSKWYTFLRDHGKDKDPNKNFSVKDGILRIAGQDFGALTTRDEYSNYEVEVVYAWGGKVWPPREKNARDCGLILHAGGEDGTVAKTFLEGIQCNMIEGATGDISITGPNKKYRFKAQAEERPAGKKAGFYWKKGAPVREFNPGDRLLWFGKDPAWENVIGFRGKNDVEKGVGQWNTLVVTMKADTMAVKLNGVTMTRATGLGTKKGKLQFQSEGAEVLFKKIILTPLD
jgi:hypothetical protein